jgi:hypothetical protein
MDALYAKHARYGYGDDGAYDGSANDGVWEYVYEYTHAAYGRYGRRRNENDVS